MMILSKSQPLFFIFASLLLVTTTGSSSISSHRTLLLSSTSTAVEEQDLFLAVSRDLLQDENHTDNEEFDFDHDHAHHDDDDDHDHDEGTTSSSSSSSNSNEKPWGKAILASLIVNLTSLAGVAILAVGRFFPWIQTKSTKRTRNWKLVSNIVPSFACGTLLATCVFIVIPEALHYIADGLGNSEEGDLHDDHRRVLEEDHSSTTTDDDHGDGGHHGDNEGAIAWRFGFAFLCGFWLPHVSRIIFPHHQHESVVQEVLAQKDHAKMDEAKEGPSLDQLMMKEGEEDEEEVTAPQCDNEECEGCEAAAKEAENAIDYSLAATILVGDCFCNFTDGIFIGTAFTLCSYDLAVAVTVSTIAHEIAQEVADFFLLTESCNLSVPKALLLNFIQGLTVTLGVLLVLAFHISEMVTGILLAMGSGVYVYIAATLCFPRATQAQENNSGDVGLSFVAFALGAIAIGLVLLNHSHC